MKRIAVFVSGGGTNLGAIIKAQSENKLGCGRVALVVSNKADAYALVRAEQAGIKSEVVLKKSFNGQLEFENRLLEILAREKIDLVVLAGFMSILSSHFTKQLENRIINIHPSLIPAFCGEGFYGLNVHKAALEKGVKVSGATVHFVTEECDGGPIILQAAVEVLEGDTPEELQQRIMQQAEWKLLPRAVQLFCDDRLEVVNGSVHIKNEV